MVEMLGVLALIGVLTVGGIAGYSKAMEMYRTNRFSYNYNNLLSAAIRMSAQLDYGENKQNDDGTTYFEPYTYLFEAMGELPEDYKTVGMYLKDPNGNHIRQKLFK